MPHLLPTLPTPTLYLSFLFVCFWLGWVFVAVCRLSLVVVSGICSPGACRGFSLRWRPLLWSTCSRCVSFRSLWALGMASVVAHGLSCLAACGNFPDQGLNPCPLHWQVDSYPLYHQGSPAFFLIISWAVISERLCKWPKVLINIVLANNNYVSSKIYYIIFTF